MVNVVRQRGSSLNGVASQNVGGCALCWTLRKRFENVGNHDAPGTCQQDVLPTAGFRIHFAMTKSMVDVARQRGRSLNGVASQNVGGCALRWTVALLKNCRAPRGASVIEFDSPGARDLALWAPECFWRSPVSFFFFLLFLLQCQTSAKPHCQTPLWRESLLL